MTLATRCSACGISFRVVQDQLKVSGGWVRCGRCNEVFNAIAGLYEVGSPMAEPVQRAPLPATETQLSALPVTEHEAAAEPLQRSRRDEPSPWPEPAASLRPAEPRQADRPGVLDDAARRLPQADVPAQPDGGAWADGAEPVPSDAPASVQDESAGEPLPSFVRAAQRAERWQRPGTRRALWGCALGLGVLLAAQAGLAYRDVVAARWPAARAPLAQACAVLGCRIEPPRHIAALTVDSSGLQQLGTSAIYTLSLVLRNRSDIELMLPALDLVLTDPQGGTVSRKVLPMAAFGRSARALGAGAELPLQASLDLGGRRVSGYTIEIFYP